MTFKHVKFSESSTMRSLERVAQQKGWFKEPSIQKTAAPIEKDLSSSSDLMSNILKLCTNMKQKGLYVEAVELENNYLNYKKAQTLYETSQETGEDVIEQAHPEGSHKLKDVEGDEAVFEDILDRHVKMLQVVQNMPTGKLDSHASILQEVKIVLADGGVGSDFREKRKEILDQLNRMARILSSAPSWDPSDPSGDYGDWRTRFNYLLTIPGTLKATPEGVSSFKQALTTARSRMRYLDPNSSEKKEALLNISDPANRDKLTYRIQNYDVWLQLEEMFKSWDQKAEELSRIVQGGPVPFIKDIEKQLSRCQGFKAILTDPGFTDSDRKQGNDWINYFASQLNTMKNIVGNISDPDQRETRINVYRVKLNKITQQMNEFESQLNA